MKYNKQKAIKYFIEQKIVEIILILVIITAIVFIPYLVGTLLPDSWNVAYSSTEPYNINISDYWLTGIFISFFGAFFIGLGLTVIYGIYKILIYWIDSNWEKAKKRAEI